MKGLAIRGKIFVKEIEYKVLFSDLKKDFLEMDTNTQINMVDDLVYCILKKKVETITDGELARLESDLKYTMNIINQLKNREK